MEKSLDDVEIFCPNCEKFITLHLAKTSKPLVLEMEGDSISFEGSCPKCKEKAIVKVSLHWNGL